MKGCLALVGLMFAFLVLIVACNAGTDDCYATPGAEDGSAQNLRDIERCS